MILVMECQWQFHLCEGRTFDVMAEAGAWTGVQGFAWGSWKRIEQVLAQGVDEWA
jgi:hypothetical protein